MGEFFGSYYVYVDDTNTLASWDNNTPIKIEIDGGPTVTLSPRTFFGDEYRISANGGHDEPKLRVQFV